MGSCVSLGDRCEKDTECCGYENHFLQPYRDGDILCSPYNDVCYEYSSSRRALRDLTKKKTTKTKKGGKSSGGSRHHRSGGKGAGGGAGLECFLGPAPPGHQYTLRARAHVAKGGTAQFDVRCGDEPALLTVFEQTPDHQVGVISVPGASGAGAFVPSLTFEKAGDYSFTQTIVCPFGGGPLEIVALPGFGGITALELENTSCAADGDNGVEGYVTGLSAFAVGDRDKVEYDEASRKLAWMFADDNKGAPGGSYFEGQCQVMQCEVF